MKLRTMTHIVWLFGLVVTAVTGGSSIGNKINSGWLSVESGDVHKHHKGVESVPEVAANHSVALKHADGQGFPAKAAVGELTCMRWTGGSCNILACNEDRRAICEEGWCVCKQGTCADSEGKCVANSESEWIGEYSIRFSKPFLPERPFLGIDPALNSQPGWSPGVPGSITWLAAASTSEKQWRIAQTPNGRIRLTNTKYPGSVLTIYNNRRRSDFMQRQAQHEQKEKKMSDDDDLWPVLINLEAATPSVSATFQVIPTMRDGGGYELWDPVNQVALASADPESWGDSVVSKGITECHTTEAWGDDCRQLGITECDTTCEGGKQLIAFDPVLPAKALAEVHRAHIVAIPIWTKWQTWFFIILGCCVGCCCCGGENDHNPPLIVHTFNYVNAMGENRAQAARAAAAERERELRTFAQKVCGLWILESAMGNFEYELKFQEDSEGTQVGISVHGRSQGSPEWDSWFDTNFIGPDQLRWEDDSSTKFTLAFGDDTSTCSGTAMAVDGQELSFTGRRTEPTA